LLQPVPWFHENVQKKHKEYISEASGLHSIAFKPTLWWYRGSSDPAEPTMSVSSKIYHIYQHVLTVWSPSLNPIDLTTRPSLDWSSVEAHAPENHHPVGSAMAISQVLTV
jgi:hypothetical protein